MRRQYRCLCEGDQEVEYFKRLQHLINAKLKCAERKSRVTFNTPKGSYRKLSKLRSPIPLVAVFDHDNDQNLFCTTCKEVARINKQRRSKSAEGVASAAYSRRCFDHWLLLHKSDCSRPAIRNTEYEPDLREAFGLSSSSDIKESNVIKMIVEQVELDDVRSAISRAKRLRSNGGGNPKTCCTVTCYDEPDLAIFEFVEGVLLEFGLL